LGEQEFVSRQNRAFSAQLLARLGPAAMPQAINEPSPLALQFDTARTASGAEGAINQSLEQRPRISEQKRKR
jgi:hypothetical protein